MTTEMSLAATVGRTTGSRPSKRLRADDKIPAVVYGQGMEPTSITIDRRELRHAVSGPAGTNALIQLTVDGVTRPTVIKELQRDPVKRRVRHVDFLVVDLTKQVTFDVPVVLVGESPEVKRFEGAINLLSSTLKLLATPATVPTELTVNVAGMKIGDQIVASQLPLPAGVELAADPNTSIVAASATRATVALQQAAAAEAKAASEAAEAAEA